MSRHQTPRRLDQPGWNGETAANETLLVHAEQSPGDTIQFIAGTTAPGERQGACETPQRWPQVGAPGIDIKTVAYRLEVSADSPSPSTDGQWARLTSSPPTSGDISPVAEEGFVDVLSMTRRNGHPRFTLSIRPSQLADEGSFREFEAEMIGDGYELDLRGALDELLIDGDMLIDIDPGLGTVALTAATTTAAGIRVVSLAAGEDALDLRRQTSRNELSGSLEVIEIADPRDAAHVAGVTMLRAGRAFAWWGRHSSMLLSPEGRSTLTDERLAGILWRNPGSPDSSRLLHLLDGSGFETFHLIHDLEGLLLQPGPACSTGGISISLRRSRIAETALRQTRR